MLTPFTGFFRMYYQLKQGNVRMRYANETPFTQKLIKAWHSTRLGKISLNIKTQSHIQFCKFGAYIFRKSCNFRTMRRLTLYGGFIVSIFWGYFFSGFMKNLYTMGYMNGFIISTDYTVQILNGFGLKDQVKYKTMHMRFIENMRERNGNVDVIDWLIAGQHCARNSEEEISYHCYYMAHLLDHEKIRTNSELQFDTIIAPNVQ